MRWLLVLLLLASGTAHADLTHAGLGDVPCGKLLDSIRANDLTGNMTLGKAVVDWAQGFIGGWNFTSHFKAIQHDKRVYTIYDPHFDESEREAFRAYMVKSCRETPEEKYYQMLVGYMFEHLESSDIHRDEP